MKRTSKFVLGPVLLGLLAGPSVALADEEAIASSGATTATTATMEDQQKDGNADPFQLNYFNILYGPSVRHPTSYQPTTQGDPDLDKPIYLKNFLAASYAVTDKLTIAPTAYWTLVPTHGGSGSAFQDPFVRVSDSSVFSTDEWNLYSDARVHFGVSATSRDNDMITGLQTFQALSYEVTGSRFSTSLYFSARGNVFGKQGFGNDWEIYVAPYVRYQVGASLALTSLYEVQGIHAHGDPKPGLVTDFNELEPGFDWDITQGVSVNPYLNIPVNGRVNWQTTSIGMMMSVRLI